MFWTKQIIQGLEFLHGNKIIHRDLRPSNIFIDGKSLVLGDIGSARSIESIKICRSQLYYSSPEVINQQDFNFEANIW